MKRLVGSGFMFMFLLLLVSANAGAAITCDNALTSLFPCVPYLVGTNNYPARTCCTAVKSLNDLGLARTTRIRRVLCYCFQNAAKSLHVDAEKAKSLPQLCHVFQVTVPIDPNVDCSKQDPLNDEECLWGRNVQCDE